MLVLRLATATLVAPLLLGGCDTAATRVEQDEAVGLASAGGVAFRVVDGLAAVVSARPGELVLRGGAPAFELVATSEAGATDTWVVELHNGLTDSVLARADGAPVSVIERPTGVLTRKRWELTLPAGAETHLRIGPADAGGREPFSFAFLSDIQDGVDRVGDVFASMNEQAATSGPPLRFVLGAGDLSQNGTREELARVQEELLALALPYYSTLGNHDVASGTWHELYGRANLSFTYHGARFTLVDSASARLHPTVFGWLQGWLEAGRGDVHVFAMHIPALDPVGVRNGAFGSRGEAAKLLTMLAEGRVDVTLYGHIHSYYAFDNAGIPAFISGGGGAFEERLDGIGRHFMVLTVDPDVGVTGTRVVRVD